MKRTVVVYSPQLMAERTTCRRMTHAPMKTEKERHKRGLIQEASQAPADVYISSPSDGAVSLGDGLPGNESKLVVPTLPTNQKMKNSHAI